MDECIPLSEGFVKRLLTPPFVQRDGMESFIVQVAVASHPPKTKGKQHKRDKKTKPVAFGNSDCCSRRFNGKSCLVTVGLSVQV